MKAVENVLKSWEGDSADGFRREANKILKNIANTAGHCQNASTCLRAAATEYRTAHDKVSSVKEPSWFDKAMDWLGDAGSRGDGGKYTAEQVRNREIPKDLLAKADEDFNGAGEDGEARGHRLHGASGHEVRALLEADEEERQIDDKHEMCLEARPVLPFPAPIAAPSASFPPPSASRPPAVSAELPARVRGSGSHGSAARSGHFWWPAASYVADGDRRPPWRHQGQPPGDDPGRNCLVAARTRVGPRRRRRWILAVSWVPGGTPGRTRQWSVPGGRSGIRGGIGCGPSEEGPSGRSYRRHARHARHGRQGRSRQGRPLAVRWPRAPGPSQGWRCRRS